MKMPEARSVLPRFVERSGTGYREYDPYSKLFEDRIIFLGCEINETSANDVMAQLVCLEYADPDRDISLYINSPGGSLTALMGIYDTMQFVKPNVLTTCLGEAVSAAAVLLAGGTAGRRSALPHARIVLHQPFTQGQRGQISDLQIQAEEILRVRTELEEILSVHTNRETTQIRTEIERDRVLTAKEALDYGLIDHIISPRALSVAEAM